ncbi:MAG: EAL domain-containing protein [Candidatus Manganitrophaceae bacterium]|nr:MAG: EAL domain-containing protein [Candidatus Manganitrophaceae bacterium]
MGTPLRVLIIEDSDEDAVLLVEALRRGGYDPTYERVDTAEALNAALVDRSWDISFGDYSMPYFNGVTALRLLRAKGLDIPFIFVSGTIGEDTAVEAMRNGANDYVLKGNLKRLLPAVDRELREAALRRERKKSSEALMESEERLRMAIHAAQMYTWDWDVQSGRVIRSGLYQEVYGPDRTASDSSYASFLQRVHPEDREKVDQAIRRTLDENAPYRISFRVVRSDGDVRWLETQGEAYRDGTGKVVRMIGVTQDISERKQVEALVQQMAFHDTLTELPNRNYLYDRLLDAIRVDEAKGRPFALLLMDLDRFKEINDTLGHHRGDLLLKEAGRRLKAVLFEPDIVARLGGDEFAILLPRLARVEDIHQVIQKIQEALRPPFVIENLPIAVEASIGVALYPDHGDTPDSLLQRADIAMYAAKQTGRSEAIYDPQYDQHSPRRLALIGELRYAIDHDQLRLHYQPKIDFNTRRVVGVEALVRWQHPEYGFVPPDQFIGPAERTGLIKSLTQWVFETALRECGAWGRSGMDVAVSVNLSARNLQEPGIVERVAEGLRSAGVAPDRLMLEITESAIMADPNLAMEVLTGLSRMGVGLSIDDFGTGYSSLAYLKRLPVDEIKIDKSFVIGMASDENDAMIVRSTIDLAHNLGLKVIAEGVESQDLWKILSVLGCDEAQGYYISRPLPAPEATRWLAESPWGIQKNN